MFSIINQIQIHVKYKKQLLNHKNIPKTAQTEQNTILTFLQHFLFRGR